ncbi:XRE family transcriptional regulator [Streptomyces armeniacus]|uniref:XRE family transcriptional regulator n=1 Tax=Streptomyces armeniacus TaxID=83291 RepID=A0A345XY88_9ACTN|nr:helix-turn-helix transcriptional regulator [Streptomyces armeniacus]AXK36604.1 XRE family transcriptional regulator [Streptomyces armeniacus]
MANIKRLDSGASPLHYFGAELRLRRNAASLTCDQLGAQLYCTGALISQIETAVRHPTEDFIRRADDALGAEGALMRMWPLLKRSRLPYKHRQIAELESSATGIYAFQPQLVHGLLQTQAYARAVLGVLDRENLDTRIEAWMARQQVLTSEEPPMYWLVLSEAVLHQEIGGAEVMHEQLTRLLSYVDTRHVQIQVLPWEVGAHTGVDGGFRLYSFKDQPGILYSDGYGAQPTANPEEFADVSLRYDLLRAAALSIEDSARLIARVLEERYDPHPETGQFPLA